MPSRAQILDAVQHPDFNPLACRVARAVADYELAFDAEARRCGIAVGGRLEPEMTIDGVYLSPKALDIWADQIGRSLAGMNTP
jgi:hypothetical protein